MAVKIDTAATGAVAAAAIAPVTVAGIALIRCGCSQVAWAVEILTAVVFRLVAVVEQTIGESKEKTTA
jgi:hypothetical protein